MKNLIWVMTFMMFSAFVYAGNITFMTYNIETDKGLNFQFLRITRHAQVIAASNADVVAVQEVKGNTNFNNLKSRSGLSGAWYDIAGNGYGIGILWKPTLGTPVITNVKIDPGPGSTDKESRAFMIAEFPDFCFISTHFSLNAIDRDTMTARIISYANSAGETVFVAGDFNAQPTFRAMVTFQNNNFQILNDLSELTFPSSSPTALIDMILGFRKNPTDKQYRVVSRGVPVPPEGVVLKDISDHLPYCVTIDIEGTTHEELLVTSDGNDPQTAGTLAWCIHQAKDGDIIEFNLDKNEIIQTESLTIPVGKSITINGLNQHNNQKIMLKGSVRAFNVSGTLHLNNIIICEKTTSSIISTGSLIVENCEFRNNRSDVDNGGAIRVSNGTCVVRNSIFENNAAGGTYGGGAICIYNEGTSLTIESSSFITNEAIQGGAISVFKAADMLAVNCTFSGNKATGGTTNRRGGAIYCANPDNNTIVEEINCTIINSTIVGNSALNNGGGICAFGRTDQKMIRIHLINTIVAYNIQGTAYNDLFNWNPESRVIITAKNCIFGTTNYSSYIDNSSMVPINIEHAPIFTQLATVENNLKVPVVSYSVDLPVAKLSANSIAIGAGAAQLAGYTVPTHDQLGYERLSPPAIGAVEHYHITKAEHEPATYPFNNYEFNIQGRNVKINNPGDIIHAVVFDPTGTVAATTSGFDEVTISLEENKGDFFILRINTRSYKIVLPKER